MNENWQSRCESLFALLIGREPQPGEIENLKQSSGNYDEFRVRLVSENLFADELGPVLDRWRESVKPSDMGGDFQIHALMHTVEVLRERQTKIEESLEKAEGEVLDLMAKLDGLVTNYVTKSEEIRELKSVAIAAASKIAEIDRAFSLRKGEMA
jgi:chromosome segregation ATPase